jgi:biotin operon repressor
MDYRKNKLNILENCLPENTVLYDATGCATDIITLYQAFGVIINLAVMPKNELDIIVDYYNEAMWGISEIVIFTKKVTALKTPKALYVNDSDFTFEKIKTMLKQAETRSKRNDGYHARLSLCLMILKKIRNCPGVSTKKMAEEYEVSEKTILRNIETLRVSGEWIEYDRESRGWKLRPNMNSFFC